MWTDTYRRPASFGYMRNVDSVIFWRKTKKKKFAFASFSTIGSARARNAERKTNAHMKFFGTWAVDRFGCVSVLVFVCGNSFFHVIVDAVAAAVVVVATTYRLAVCDRIVSVRIFVMYFSSSYVKVENTRETNIFPNADVCFIFFVHN